jgi:hypothetical protein
MQSYVCFSCFNIFVYPILGTQLGPWFYAPALTSYVTPLFLSFLVGPSSPNLRKDGRSGGMVVEKCKFLQESGCKGLCLHQCKLPAQQFFAQTLGVSLTVTPNFETQECQWSWGEIPVEPEKDASFPRGCLAGCPMRGVLKEHIVNTKLQSTGMSFSQKMTSNQLQKSIKKENLCI